MEIKIATIGEGGTRYLKPKMIDCPNHEGGYDCTPFCPLCEGEQEIPADTQRYRTFVALDHPKGGEWRTLWKSDYYSQPLVAERVGFEQLHQENYPNGAHLYLAIENETGRTVTKLENTLH